MVAHDYAGIIQPAPKQAFIKIWLAALSEESTFRAKSLESKILGMKSKSFGGTITIR
jgi:hypothetical protein